MVPCRETPHHVGVSTIAKRAGDCRSYTLHQVCGGDEVSPRGWLLTVTSAGTLTPSLDQNCDDVFHQQVALALYFALY
jgi:hypothetical protein